MIVLPWIGFGVAIAWMIRSGLKAKAEYLRRKAKENDIAAASFDDPLHISH